MNMKNRVNLIGRLTVQPECQQSKQGKAYMNFDLAVDKETGKKNDADFISCCAFGKVAEFITSHFSKGQMINVLGSVITSVWVDKNGTKQKQMKVKISNVDFYGFMTADEDSSTESLQERNKLRFGDMINDVCDDIIDDDFDFCK